MFTLTPGGRRSRLVLVYLTDEKNEAQKDSGRGLGLESELQGAFMMRGEVLGVGSHVGKGDSLRASKMKREEKKAFLWVPGLEPRTSPLLCSEMLSLCSLGPSSPQFQL